MTGPRGRSRSELPRARIPQAAHQLHVVGEPEGRGGQQPVRRRVPRSRQHWDLRSLEAAAHRRPSRAGGRHGVDGILLRHDALHRARVGSEDPAYEDVASKFFEHYVAISDAMNALGGDGLWDEKDGFYYDRAPLRRAAAPLRIRSMVGHHPAVRRAASSRTRCSAAAGVPEAAAVVHRQSRRSSRITLSPGAFTRATRRRRA